METVWPAKPTLLFICPFFDQPTAAAQDSCLPLAAKCMLVPVPSVGRAGENILTGLKAKLSRQNKTKGKPY